MIECNNSCLLAWPIELGKPWRSERAGVPTTSLTLSIPVPSSARSNEDVLVILVFFLLVCGCFSAFSELVGTALVSIALQL